MIKLQKLVFSGFRSFKDEASVVFPEDGAMLISGKYSDNSGGSSGSGKSSIPLAIAYAMGFCEVPATELKNWYSKKYSVSLTLSSDGQIIEIIRNPKLALLIDGVAVPGSADELEKKLAEIIKTDINLVKSLVYRPQLESGKFLNSTDAQTKEFLSTVLGLQQIEAAHDKIGQDLSSAKNALGSLSMTVAALEQRISSMAVDPSSIARAQTALEAATLEYGKSEAVILEAEEKYAEAMHVEVMAKTKADSLVPDTSKNEAEWLRLSGEAKKIQGIIQQYNGLIRDGEVVKAQNRTIRTQIMSLQSEIEHLSQNTCPTCQREWNESAGLAEKKGAQIDQLLATMQANISKISQGEQVVELIPQLQQDYDNKMKEANLARKPPEELVLAHQSALTAWNQQKSVTMSHKMALDSAKRSAMSAKSAVDAANREIAAIESMNKAFAETHRDLEIKKEEQQAKQRQVEKLELAHRLIGRDGFLGVIFDEVLAEIESRANEMINSIPNIATFTLVISSVATTKAGAIKKTITKKVMKDGFEVSIKALSGGQIRALELCMDLAVRETIRARFGSPIGFIILDEAMENLGAFEKGLALEMIKTKVQGQIIIIDHATEIKEGFASTIDVKFDGRNSWIA